MTALCALCTTPILGVVTREPLGRNGALVAVCANCATEHPRSGRYAFDGGRPDPRSERYGSAAHGEGNRCTSSKGRRVG